MTLSEPSGGLSTGAGNVGGIARGEIVIGTASLAQTRNVVIREAQLMGKALQEGIGSSTEAGVKQAQASLNQLEDSLGSVKRSAGLVLLALTTMGLKSAQSVKVLELRFRALSGSEEKAAEHLETLRKLAEKSGQPFLEMAEGATALLPAVRGTNADLGKTVMLAQRLATMDPMQGITGASLAIREFLSGEYLSLVRRLELNRTRLRKIRDEANGDVAKMIEGLSDYIGEIGLSEEAMYEFGRSGVTAFLVLRDEGKQTLASFFDPLLNNYLVPIARAFADLLAILRRVSPELREFIAMNAALLAISGIGSKGLPIIGVLPGGKTLGKVAVGGALVYGGAHVGVEATRIAAAAGVGGFERFEGKSHGDVAGALTDTLKQVLVIVVNALGQLAVYLRQGGMLIGNAFKVVKAELDLAKALLSNAFALVVDVLGKAVGGIVDAVAGILEGLDRIDLGPVTITMGTAGVAADMRKLADGARSLGDGLRVSKEEMDGYVNTLKQGAGLTAEQEADLQKMRDGISDVVISLSEGLGLIEESVDAAGEKMGVLAQFIRDVAGVVNEVIASQEGNYLVANEEAITAWLDFQDEMRELDEEYRADLEEEGKSYTESITKIETDAHKQIADIVEQEAERAKRAAAELARQIAAVEEDRAEKIADSEAQRSKRIAELRAEYQDAEAEAEEEHQRKLARIQRDGRESMLEAASRLDAVGVFNAQRNMERSLRDADENYNLEKAERAKRLAEAIAQENEAHQERVAAAEKAAAKRIETLQEQYAREEEEAKKNADSRIAEIREQAAEQLREEQKQHAERLRKLVENLKEEKQKKETAFIQTMNAIQYAAGMHEQNLIAIHRQGQATAEQDLRAWWARVSTMFGTGPGGTTTYLEGVRETEGRYVTWLGKRVRVDKYDPAWSGGMSAGDWYLWKMAHGFKRGGFTGYGPADRIAGATHYGEWVVPKEGAPVVHSPAIERALDRAWRIMDSAMRVINPSPVMHGGGQVAGLGTRHVTVGNIYVQGASDPEATARAVRAELMAIIS